MVHLRVTTKFSGRFFAIWLLLGFLSTTGSAAFADVRILLDISRSMADGDSNRIRQDALDLIVAGIPNGEKAGIWTFGQYVNLLMPHETVTNQWRAEAERKLNAQTYPATRTNMGRALEEATYDFNFSTFQGDVDLILVTDGKVDIAPNEEVNRVERERILNRVIPEYRAAGARIHTLVLSDEADLSLLRQMSEQTGGYYQLTQTSQDLTTAMLALSDEVSPMAQLPMRAQTFDVDSRIRELTVLMYHSQGAVSLVAPDGTMSSAVRPGSQRWRVGNGFSQVSISSPASGRWQVRGDLDPGSQIRVISDISVEWNAPMQPVLAKGSLLEIEATLIDDAGNPLSESMTSLVEATVRVDGQSVPVQVEKGSIRARYQAQPQATDSIIELTVDGGTFNRLLSRQVRYVEPYLSEVLVTGGGYQWRIYPNRYLNTDDVQFSANVSYQTDSGMEQKPFRQTDAGYWMFEFPATMPMGQYELSLSGHLLSDEGIIQLPKESISVSLPVTANTSYAMTPDALEARPETMAETPMQVSAEFIKDPMPEFAELQPDLIVDQVDASNDWNSQTGPADNAKNDSNWLTYLLVSLPGVLILVLGFLAYRRLEQRAKPAEKNDEELILGGDEFSSLDDVDQMQPDKDLDLSMLDDDVDDFPPETLQNIDDIPHLEDEVMDLEEDLPPPQQTEAPTLAQEDMLDATDAGATAADDDLITESDPDEELFDISSIDDDLADLDLALDGDDPFNDDEDLKPDN